MENFAVKSNSFALYEAFKKDVEAIGWKYNHQFSVWDKDMMESNDCLYFSSKWNDVVSDPMFAFSNVSGDNHVFQLEAQYGDALAFAEQVYNNQKSKEPIVGEMAIFWDYNKNEAVTAINSENEHSYVNEFPYQANDGTIYMHAIPYESAEQYKSFLKS